MELFEFVQKWNFGNTISVHDNADKLHYIVTTVLLSVCVTIVSVKQYFFEPISCYVPGKPIGANFEDYIANLCWVEGTYAYLNLDHFNKDMLKDSFWEKEEKIVYYQWIPFFLGFQCICFFIPRVLWQIVTDSRETTDLESLIQNAKDASRCIDWKRRKEEILSIARLFDDLLVLRRELKSPKHCLCGFNCKYCFPLGKRKGNRLCFSYILLKCVFMLNSIGQLYLMGLFIAPSKSNNWLYGFEVFANVTKGNDWSISRAFPRLSFCRVKVRHIASVNTYLGQCALPINMLNEKIYIFLWIWYTLISALMFYSMIKWTVQMIFSSNKRKSVKILLRMQHTDNWKLLQVPNFVGYLRNDGVFLIQMIKLNVGDLLTSQMVRTLFDKWLEDNKDDLAMIREPVVTIRRHRRMSYNINPEMEDGDHQVTQFSTSTKDVT